MMVAAAHPPLVLLVDDEPMVTSAASRLLRTVGVEVLTALSPSRALVILEHHAATIGLVISDYGMPGLSGAEFLRLVRVRWPHVTRALLTGQTDVSAAADAVNEGQIARLFLKPWQPQEIVRSVVQLLADGGLQRENQRLHRLLDGANSPALRAVAGAVHSPIEPLTERELGVLALVAEGLTNREIGQRLFLSAATVKVHVAHTTAKLGVTDRTQAAVRGVSLGLIQPNYT